MVDIVEKDMSKKKKQIEKKKVRKAKKQIEFLNRKLNSFDRFSMKENYFHVYLN